MPIENNAANANANAAANATENATANATANAAANATVNAVANATANAASNATANAAMEIECAVDETANAGICISTWCSLLPCLLYASHFKGSVSDCCIL
jgi:hypothetical protein